MLYSRYDFSFARNIVTEFLAIFFSVEATEARLTWLMCGWFCTFILGIICAFLRTIHDCIISVSLLGLDDIFPRGEGIVGNAHFVFESIGGRAVGYVCHRA